MDFNKVFDSFHGGDWSRRFEPLWSRTSWQNVSIIVLTRAGSKRGQKGPVGWDGVVCALESPAQGKLIERDYYKRFLLIDLGMVR